MQSWIHVIEWRATVHPDLPALIDDRGARYTYAQLRGAIERHAGGWASLGVRPGDRVAIVAKNSADFLVQSFAILRAGATPAFVNWRLSAGELADVLALVEPAAIAADAEFTVLSESATSILCESATSLSESRSARTNPQSDHRQHGGRTGAGRLGFSCVAYRGRPA
jgi:acyl-CoA synthetase (AMP-forming)/AMP-acid ligase II